ncbi:hypothetical protein ACKI1I_19785 [Streptomyces turgidiscabies]|uniref:Uncharacterized protein n=1 Tax=Streptomyces turgidiscabies (strain Car8) TaxID=698760 RepID=L7FGZ8_STRT8|nr:MULTISPECIES: hypothetical protein [Streptomyces]ELP70658.1 hypothetical protein STRTUCAR8_09601 [Streptomyces turgidiscabies Car8]MDX3491901.1 hypothetical protein [Streptomyces turgidiscabies]GAQ71982.1 hypothetical protein T45_03727 [Streptomyces turgidiscabies]
MNLPRAVTETVTPYRILVVEGHEGLRRACLYAELALLGFPSRQPPDGLHHLDPTRPFRDLLAAPGRFVVDGGIIGELVYGPLRRGRSRVTWIQVLDLAEAVAEREGALVHLTGGDHGDDGSESAAAALAYARVFRTLAQHVPVVRVDVTSARTDVVAERTRRIRAPAPHLSQLRRSTRQLTIG